MFKRICIFFISFGCLCFCSDKYNTPVDEDILNNPDLDSDQYDNIIDEDDEVEFVPEYTKEELLNMNKSEIPLTGLTEKLIDQYRKSPWGWNKEYHGFINPKITNKAFLMLANYECYKAPVNIYDMRLCEIKKNILIRLKSSPSVQLKVRTAFYLGKSFEEVEKDNVVPVWTMKSKNGKTCFWWFSEIAKPFIGSADSENVHVVFMIKFNNDNIAVDEILTVEKGIVDPIKLSVPGPQHYFKCFFKF